jgi:hypothetical protein
MILLRPLRGQSPCCCQKSLRGRRAGGTRRGRGGETLACHHSTCPAHSPLYPLPTASDRPLLPPPPRPPPPAHLNSSPISTPSSALGCGRRESTRMWHARSSSSASARQPGYSGRQRATTTPVISTSSFFGGWLRVWASQGLGQGLGCRWAGIPPACQPAVALHPMRRASHPPNPPAAPAPSPPAWHVSAISSSSMTLMALGTLPASRHCRRSWMRTSCGRGRAARQGSGAAAGRNFNLPTCLPLPHS